MILTDRQIQEACEKGDIVIEPFDAKQIQAATYDLRVGDQGATTSTKRRVSIKETGYISLQPGDFAVVMALEEIRIGSQYAARFGLRSKFARKGLIATTGPQIDPGYHGRLIIGLINLTPKSITLSYKDDFLSVEFHRLEEPASKPYDGPFQDVTELRPEEIEMITESEGMALSEVLTTLRTLSFNVGELAKDISTLATEVRTLKWAIPALIGIVGLGIAIISVIVAFK